MSGDNVIHLPKPEEYRAIWVCNCGCTVQHLHADGHASCAECEAIASEDLGSWRLTLPDVKSDTPEIGPDNFKVVELDSAATFLRRRLREDAAEAVAIVQINADGSMATFLTSKVETEDWLRDKMAAATERMSDNIDRKGKGPK
jgi:hypothetical protein